MADEVEVWRGGHTSPYITRSKSADWQIRSGHPITQPRAPDSLRRDGVTVKADIPSKGGGRTRVYVWIPPSLYGHLAAAMLRGAPKAAETAFHAQMAARKVKDAERS